MKVKHSYHCWQSLQPDGAGTSISSFPTMGRECADPGVLKGICSEHQWDAVYGENVTSIVIPHNSRGSGFFSRMCTV
jgi:hypothetical protein